MLRQSGNACRFFNPVQSDAFPVTYESDMNMVGRWQQVMCMLMQHCSMRPANDACCGGRSCTSLDMQMIQHQPAPCEQMMLTCVLQRS
jgi:hypothetical protein